MANHDASSNQASKAPETTTIYQLTDQLEAGGEYLIVNTNEAGDGVALGHNETAITSNDVEIYSNDENLYIKADDVNTTSVWTASEKGEHMKLTNDVYILQIPYNPNYKIYAYKNDESFDGSWVYQDDYLQYTYINKNKKRVTYTVVYNDGYKFANNKEGKVYLYKKVEGPSSTQKTFDLTISDAGWATLFLDYAVTIPDGLSKVFYINSIVDDVAKGRTVTGVIPQLTGVIIQGNAGTYQFRENSNSVEKPTDNLLTETLEANTDAREDPKTSSYYRKNLYTLGRTKSGNVQLALFTGTSIGKNKAFLITSATDSQAKAFSIVTGSGATAIHALDNVGADHEEWYTLQGTRLNGKPTKKGVYIHGGKRIYVK